MTRLAALTVMLISGCTSVAPSRVPINHSQTAMHSAFVRESAKFEHGDCLGSLDFQLSDTWNQFGQKGVTADAEGVFLFLAGDSYIWVAGLYAGRTSTGYRLVSAQPSETETAQEFTLSKTEFHAILDAARRSIEPTSSLSSRRDHDPCEYLVIRSSTDLVVRATRQALNNDSDGVENEGGFRIVRELMERTLTGSDQDDRE